MEGGTSVFNHAKIQSNRLVTIRRATRVKRVATLPPIVNQNPRVTPSCQVHIAYLRVYSSIHHTPNMVRKPTTKPRPKVVNMAVTPPLESRPTAIPLVVL